MHTKLIYAELNGARSPAVMEQLLRCPPDGYRFITRRSLVSAFADATSQSRIRRGLQYATSRFLPTNLLLNYGVTRFVRPPAPVALTYSMSTIVFRREPWVLYLENPIQLAGFTVSNLRRFRAAIEKGLRSRFCRAIFLQSEAARRALTDHLDVTLFEHKLHVEHYWGWVPKPNPGGKTIKSDTRFRILFVGSNTRELVFQIKGGIQCLEAFAVLRQRFPHVELTIRSQVGASIRRRFMGMPGLRIIEGLISTSEIEDLYSQADVFWYPAHCLMSITMLEAMAHGVPVVTTNYYDNPEFVRNGETGIVIPHHRYIPPWDTSQKEVLQALGTSDRSLVENLVRATTVLIHDEPLRERMGQAARQYVTTRFSLYEKNRRLKALLDDAVAPSEDQVPSGSLSIAVE